MGLEEGTGGSEEPVHCVPEILGVLRFSKVSLDVLHGRFEDVEPIPQVVERLSGDDQL